MKKILILSLILSCCMAEKAYSELNKTITKSYTDSNGNTVARRLVFSSNGVSLIHEDGHGGDYNYIEVDDDGNTIYNGFYYGGRITFIVNSNGDVLARKPSWSAEIDETYQYTDTGKALRYNTSGELLGAYEDSVDAFLVARRFKDYSLTDTNGNFTDYDDKGNILGVYYANGEVDSYKYNYDKGGNLISSYKNGVVIYRRRIYTPAEATAAVQKGGKNNFSLTYR